MPDLMLSEDQRQYQHLAGEFARNEILPRAQVCDREALLPIDVLRKAWELGLLNARIPEPYGGMGLALSDVLAIAEELGSACTGIASVFEGNELVCALVLAAGSETQKQDLFGLLTSNFGLAACCLPVHSSDAASAITYRRTADGFRLAGEAIAINAQEPVFWIVFAHGEQGPCLFAVANVEEPPQIDERVSSLGRRASALRRVRFDTAIPADSLLGAAGEGGEIFNRADAEWCPILAAEAAGLGRSAMEHSIRYSRERFTFGKPIASHQAVSFMIADMAKDVEASRLLARKAAWLVDNGTPDLRQSRMALSYAVDAAMRISTDAVQVFGGYGYMKEYPVEKLMRDAKEFQLFGASSYRRRVDIGKDLISTG